MSTVENATSSPAMPKTVRQKGITHVLCDVTLIQKIGLPWKPFVHTLSSAGVRKLLRDLKTPKISRRREKCWRGQSFVMDRLQQYLNGVERGKLLTRIKPIRRRKPGRCSSKCWCVNHDSFKWSNRVEIVKWVAESMRPLSIVEDKGFKTLMKTGRPNYKLPKRMTVARDVNQVFKKTKKRMKKLLQVSWFVGNWQFLTDLLGTRRGLEFWDWRLDVTKPQSICGHHGTFRAEWDADLPSAWCGSSSIRPHRNKPRKSVRGGSEGLWYSGQGQWIFVEYRKIETNWERP